MRKYGNMFRAGDSPDAAAANRIRTVDLRLLSRTTAVHSDMFMWHKEESTESAARQFLNVFFSVPQISVRLEDIMPDQLTILRHYTEYWMETGERVAAVLYLVQRELIHDTSLYFFSAMHF